MSERIKNVTTPCNLNTPRFLRNRELNLKPTLRYNNDVQRKIYSSIDAGGRDTPLQKSYGNQGGIYNLEFNSDGRYLAAACEKESVLLFDAGNQKQIHMLRGAHSACVNNVRFLDDVTFVTCSDDTTVKLWDTRKLTEATRVMLGNSNWVKNIDYIEDGKLLITSSLDGSIYVWDLQDCTETHLHHESLLLLHGITRSRLTPDQKKMIISTTGGYLIIVHDLDILRLCTELRAFRPNVYRLMQITEQTYPCSTMYSYLFNQNRRHNRLEFVDDFPIDAEIITSLEIHPMGWSAVSRSINSTESGEWTSVHDIQTRHPSEYAHAYKYVEEIIDVEEQPEITLQRPTDIWISFTTHQNIVYYRSQQVPYPMESAQSSMGIINSGLIGYNIYNRQFRNRPNDKNRIVMTIPRLTHSISEEIVAKGLMKELCFSNDGRVICSPHNKGVRLLGFNANMEELCYCVPDTPQQLKEICVMDNYHSNYVLSCKFSPQHCQLVSGCVNGDIVWYKPFL